MDLETRLLRQLLTNAQQLPEVLLLKQTTTSTNDDVREIAQKGMKGILVCSEMQTQGRGQRQRQWVSPVGNIYLSTMLETRTALDGRLALEIALNATQAYERLGSPEGELAIANAVVYCAIAPKSNSIEVAYNAVKSFVKKESKT